MPVTPVLNSPQRTTMDNRGAASTYAVPILAGDGSARYGFRIRGPLVEACIGLAVPGRPIGPKSRRTGAGGVRDRTGPNLLCSQIAHGTGRNTPK
jgi:hypothetical protein